MVQLHKQSFMRHVDKLLCGTRTVRLLVEERRQSMKTWISIIIKFWWLLQGIILLVFGFFVWTPISVMGILIIICDCLYDNRNNNVRVLSRFMLMICALACMIYVGMLIAVGSPQIWFTVSLVFVGVVNVILSIKLVISSLLGR